MITDKLLTFCKATALNTGAAGTYLIGSQIDLTDARDIGNLAKPMWLVIQFPTVPDSAAEGATLQFKVASDDTAAVHTSTSTVHLTTPVFTEAQFSLPNFRYMAPLPMEGLPYERFLGLLQGTGGEAITSGTITALLTIDPPAWKAYPEGMS